MEDDKKTLSLAPIAKPVEGWVDSGMLAAKVDEVIDRVNLLLMLLVQVDDLEARLNALESAAKKP